MASAQPATSPTLKVGVSDFGPIVRGKVSLRPLTVFVGPNNSGKSYLAMLLYTLWHSFSPRPVYATLGSRAAIRRFRLAETFWLPLASRDRAELLQALKDWLQELTPSAARSRVALDTLPVQLRQAIERAIRSSAKQTTSNVESELRRCFGTEISSLARVGAKTQSFRVSVHGIQPAWRLQFRALKDAINSTLSVPDIGKILIQPDLPSFLVGESPRLHLDWEGILPELMAQLAFNASNALYRPLLTDTYYFPAARSGILQSHRAVAAFVVSRSPLVGIEEPVDIPRFTGVVTDFLSALLMMERENDRPLAKVASFLEENVTGGFITMEVGKLEYPEIYYEPLAGGRFPLRSTSSMVSELAPVVLFLKYIIDPEDFLIIEEPESHLHPDNQRRLARGLVKLVRSGVRVLITTHSDFFLSQLTNFIHLSLLSPEGRAAHGYDPGDYLDAQDIGAYLFECVPEQGGSFIKRLNITSREGIPQEELSKVSQALYQESVRLEREVLK